VVPLGHQTGRGTGGTRTRRASEDAPSRGSICVRGRSACIVVESGHGDVAARKREAQTYRVTLVHPVGGSRQDRIVRGPVRIEDLPDEVESGIVAGSRS
jgi:hypothetical protein